MSRGSNTLEGICDFRHGEDVTSYHHSTPQPPYTTACTIRSMAQRPEVRTFRLYRHYTTGLAATLTLADGSKQRIYHVTVPMVTAWAAEIAAYHDTAHGTGAAT